MDYQQFRHAFVLHTRPYRDTSLLVETFSLEMGRVSVIARGVKRPKSTWAGLLRPFQALLMNWRGQRELKTLVGVELDGMLQPITGQALIAGLYCNELLIRLLHEKELPFPALYRYYAALMQGLAQGEDLELLLRQFEYRLFTLLGFELPLTHEAESQNPVHPEQWYIFDPEQGPRPTKQSPRSNLHVFSGESLLALANFDLSTKPLRLSAKRIMRIAINRHLGGRPLKSRALWLAYNKE